MHRNLALLLLCSLFAYQSARAGAIDEARKSKLAEISNEMFQEHNSRYIIVDAFRDGFLKLGESYEAELTDSTISFNGRRLDAKAEQQYRSRIDAFKSNGNLGFVGLFSRFSSDGASYEQVIDPKSIFRNRAMCYSGRISESDAHGALLAELQRDKLITDVSSYRIIYTQRSLQVNSLSLSGAMAEKYKMLFRILLSFEPQKESDIYVVRHGA